MLPDKVRAALIPCDLLVGIQAVKLCRTTTGRVAQLGERLVDHEELRYKFCLSSRLVFHLNQSQLYYLGVLCESR